MGKKIIVGCDGKSLSTFQLEHHLTYLKSEVGFQRTDYLPGAKGGYKVTPSNVTRLCRALEPRPPNNEDKEGVAPSGNFQIVDYEPGIGSANNWWDHFINGATADSIGANVSAGYSAIAEKYEDGDEIFLIGFSRGSFVARSIAAMIRYVGLLTKQGMENFYDVFTDWENQNTPEYKQRLYPNLKFDDETDKDYCSYSQALAKDKLTRLNIRIKAIAVFDTVGSLGVPTVGWRKPTRTYAFVNTEVLSNADYCFQACALDEIRNPFGPTLWELPENRIGPNSKNPGVLKQCWFPGAHSNVGGSVFDAELPNVALSWMVQQLSPLLDFDVDYLQFAHQVNKDWYKTQNLPERLWGMGYIANPVTGIQILGGQKPRTPGRYFRTSPETGVDLPVRLQNTNEGVHPSVRVRRYNRLNGKGMDDVGTYDPPALKAFRLFRRDGLPVDGPEQGDPKSKGWEWRMEDPVKHQTVVLPEHELGPVELALLDVEGLAPSS